jgi:exosortase/archaeosortase family protein
MSNFLFFDNIKGFIVKCHNNNKTKGLLYITLIMVLYVIGRYINIIFMDQNFHVEYLINDYLIKIELETLRFYFNKVGLFDSIVNNMIIFTNGNYLHILPFCSGFNQMLRMTFVLLFLPGPFKNKIWYVPLSMVLVLFLALLHLIILSYVVIIIPEYYNISHAVITRLIFFALYLLIWVFWLEKFVLNNIKERIKSQ